MIQGPLTQGADQWKVGDILSNLCWDWDRIPFELPSKVKSIIQATPIPVTSKGQDKLAWSSNLKGSFDLKSAYFIVIKEDSAPPLNYGWIWKLHTLPRIQTFLWLCMHNSTGVKVCLVKRGVVVDELCPTCQREPESIIHAIRDCVWVKTIWIQLGVSISNQVFWTSNLQDWMILNGKASSNCDRGNLPWKSIFSFAVWCIWKNRNMVVFNRKSSNQNLSKEIMNQSLEFFYCV